MISSQYKTNGFYDELFAADGEPHQSVLPLVEQLERVPLKVLIRWQKSAEAALHEMGITFSVQGNNKGLEKIFPFDIIPRIIQAKEWKKIEKGLKQRTRAINLFLDDIYHDQRILKDKVIPKEIIYSSGSYLKSCEGMNPPLGIWSHINGTDLVRDKFGTFLVLEDNMRCPSGASYVLENRSILKQTFPFAFRTMNVQPVGSYPEYLLETLQSISPNKESANIVILTPGIYNSAYYEHSYLAKEMGVQLAEGADLVVKDDFVYLRTTKGIERVDVIYRRIDDDYLDPKVFKKDSLLGVPGIMKCYKKGNVALANAPGTGIADDKAIYAYVPKIIKYYLDEEILIPNIETYLCADEKQCDHVIKNIDQFVVKHANMSGGYGMLFGAKATKEEKENYIKGIKKAPRNFIAQPVIDLSRSPTIVGKKITGRHVDFRPYILNGQDIKVMPGGLTRVALVEGSLVVNSSQGGGSKDTWVLAE